MSKLQKTLEKCCKDPNHNRRLCIPYDESIKIEFDGFGEMILELMRRNGDKVAQIDSKTGNVETYSEMVSKCIRIAANMERIGLQQRDIVTFCTMNNLDSYSAVLGCTMAGARFSAIDPIISLRETAHMLKLLDTKFIFCDESGLKIIEAALEETKLQVKIITFGSTSKYIPFSELLKSIDNEQDYKAKKSKLEDTLSIYFSSGTTGLPKGIAVSHFSHIYSSLMPIEKGPLAIATRLSWISALILTGVCIYNGISWVLSTEFNLDEMLHVISAYKVTAIITPPLYAYQVTKYPKSASYDLSSLTMYFILGGAISKEQILDLRKLFPKAVTLSSYGITETCGQTLSVSREDIPYVIANPCTLGRPSNGCCFKVIDVETERECGPNEPGELRIKSAKLMNGYYNDIETTKKTFDKDGYFCTGDMMYYDENYFFYFVDRIKELTKVTAFFVGPAELEDLLLSHPDVIEAVVIFIPHEEDMNHPMAVVKLSDNAKASAEDIQKFVDEQVTDYKRLRAGVKIVNNLPKTASYKHRRREIRDMVLNKEI